MSYDLFKINAFSKQAARYISENSFAFIRFGITFEKLEPAGETNFRRVLFYLEPRAGHYAL